MDDEREVVSQLRQVNANLQFFQWLTLFVFIALLAYAGYRVYMNAIVKGEEAERRIVESGSNINW